MALIDDKVKIYLRVNEDAELSDLSGNTTWYNSAQIVRNGGVHNGYCLYFDNVDKTHELYSTSVHSGTFDFTKSKWTISLWFKMTGYYAQTGLVNNDYYHDETIIPIAIFSGENKNNQYLFNVFQLAYNMANSIYLSLGYKGHTGSSFLPITENNNLINEWTHYAWVRNENTLTIYMNGIAIDTINDFTSWISSNNPNLDNTNMIIEFFKSDDLILTQNYGSLYFKCYLDEFCIVEDALWTGAFTPPTTYLYDVPEATHKKWPSASWNMFKYNFKSFHDKTIQELESLLENIIDYGTFYGTCTSTSASTTKSVTCPNFVLKTGAKVIVLFSNANSAAAENLKMNVNSTGAKEIYYKGTKLPSNTIVAGSCLEFVYDGTRYQLVGS